MVEPKQTKSIFYLDRDTNIETLIDKMLSIKKEDLRTLLAREQEKLQEKEPGEYTTIEDTAKLKNNGLENMQRFFRSAVVPYYARQEYDILVETIDSGTIRMATDEVKRRVGFMRYNHEGRMTTKTNSMLTFEKEKDLQEFLDTVKNVCFDDHEYIFPDSKRFKDLEKQKGREATQRQMLSELNEKIKNKYYQREITD